MTNSSHDQARAEEQESWRLINRVIGPLFHPLYEILWLFLKYPFRLFWPIIRYQFKFRWTITKNVFKVSIVVASFLGFCLAIRQYELQRFNEVKGIFEVDTVTEAIDGEALCGNDKPCIRIKNYGKPVVFVGCSSGTSVGNIGLGNGYGVVAESLTYPKKYTFVRPEHSILLGINRNISNYYSTGTSPYFPLFCWFRDIDLNWYEVSIVPKLYVDSFSKKLDFYIDGVPKAYRTENLFYAVPDEKLYWLFNLAVQQDWFQDRDPRPGREYCIDKQLSRSPGGAVDSGLLGDKCLLPLALQATEQPQG